MNKFRLAFALSSVIFLVVLAISPLKDYFAEWKGYQKGYNDIIASLPQRIEPGEIGLKQQWIENLDRVDRCTSCHLGLGEKALADAPQPFTAHPPMYHDIEDFGCTVCHGGQGRATTTVEAHGEIEYWETPLIPARFMEASCGKCHKEKTMSEAPLLTLGRRLIEESNCVACHKISDMKKQWVPSLDGIGEKVNREWLFNWLKNPKAYFPGARMPNFMLSDEEANNLTDYLMTFRTFSGGDSLEPLPAQSTGADGTEQDKLVKLGTTRFREARCISCHPINGRGGYVATDLGKIASKATPEWLFNYIRNPKRLQPGVRMPRYRFSETEVQGVVAYIESEFVDYDMPEPTPHTPDPAFYEKGLAVLKKYNCTACHTLGKMKSGQEMGPELTTVGSKNLYQIDFGKADIVHSLPSYFFTKLKTPRIFSGTMKMPDFGFTDRQARAITVALLSNTEEAIPRDLVIRDSSRVAFKPQGEFGRLVDDLACFGCHTMFGQGRLVATDLSMEGSQARPEWISKYFTVPYSLRPTLTERMPKLFLKDSEIRTIVDYLGTVCIADSLDREIPQDAGTVAKGKILYFGTYGCQGCHQIGQRGGYVGPPLDHVGSRLTPGWVFHWLKNPRQFRFDTIEPNHGLNDEEADALTAYLMSLK